MPRCSSDSTKTLVASPKGERIARVERVVDDRVCQLDGAVDIAGSGFLLGDLGVDSPHYVFRVPMPQVSFTKLGEQRETGRALRTALIDEDKAATHPGGIHREVIAGMLGHLHRFGGVPVSRRVGEQRPGMDGEAVLIHHGDAIKHVGSTLRTIAIA